MKVHFVEHVLFEYPGYLVDWATAQGHSISYTKLYETKQFPETAMFDLLVILGGPMGVYEEAIFPWLKEEKIFIQKAIAADKKVLGICLGSQLIAEVLGSKVYPHQLKEIGWWPIEKVQNHCLIEQLPQHMTVFHWHGDTFDLPNGAVHLFRSAGCEQQGFIVGKNVAGLQFHMEVKEDLLLGMTAHERDELVPEKFVQSEKNIHDGIRVYANQQNNYLHNFIETFIRL